MFWRQRSELRENKKWYGSAAGVHAPSYALWLRSNWRENNARASRSFFVQRGQFLSQTKLSRVSTNAVTKANLQNKHGFEWKMHNFDARYNPLLIWSWKNEWSKYNSRLNPTESHGKWLWLVQIHPGARPICSFNLQSLLWNSSHNDAPSIHWGPGKLCTWNVIAIYSMSSKTCH